MEVDDYISKYKPCAEALEWCQENGVTTLADAWDRVPPKYLIWMVTRPGVLSDRDLRLFACWCVRQVWDLLTDERSIRAVEVAERFAAGAATQQELFTASDAAWYAAIDAASDAARAAASDAAMAAAWYAARYAARAAARAAAMAAASSDAASAAQAAHLRSLGNPYRNDVV